MNLSTPLSVKLNLTGMAPVLMSYSSLIELVLGVFASLSSNMLNVPRRDAEGVPACDNV